MLSLNIYRGSTVVHYDPDREDHKQFEQNTSEKTEKQEANKPVQEKQSEEPVLPEVSQDKYHHVNTASLADLFGNKNQIKETKVCPISDSDPEEVPYCLRISLLLNWKFNLFVG